MRLTFGLSPRADVFETRLIKMVFPVRLAGPEKAGKLWEMVSKLVSEGSPPGLRDCRLGLEVESSPAWDQL